MSGNVVNLRPFASAYDYPPRFEALPCDSEIPAPSAPFITEQDFAVPRGLFLTVALAASFWAGFLVRGFW